MVSVKKYVATDGTPLVLGKELGRGGEGSVFAVPGHPEVVAKIYHKPLDPIHQSKIRVMVGQSDSVLNQYVAWPRQTLHAAAGGPVLGFTMSKMANREAAHAVYSPAHRKQEKPGRKWDFLLLAARNSAAAVNAVHSRGHVIGDVNQNGVLIGDDGKAALIDSDSFQIRSQGRVFRCRVGVPEFTPPELQGVSSFDAIDRTANHDNFGLAVLIFHMLLGGRHPFAGVPLRPDVGNEMSQDIRAFRYADGRDNQVRGLTPPPRTVPVSLLPDSIADMMFRAFTEHGVRNGRPTAAQWVKALDGVRGSVKACPRNASHRYPGRGRCPWCELDAQGVVHFAIPVPKTVSSVPTKFDIDKLWRAIEQVAPPSLPAMPNPHTIQCAPTPKPAKVPSKGTIAGLRWLVALGALATAFGVSSMWWIGLLVGFVGLSVVSALADPLTKERARRKQVHESAKSAYEALERQYKIASGVYARRRSELAELKSRYAKIDTQEAAELAELRSKVRDRLRARYLQNCFIDRASISGIGPQRKSSLRSFGIETAYDVERWRVRQVPGFGETYTQSMLDWRASCERRFVFNPSDPSIKADEAALKARFASERAAIQRSLVAGAQRLQLDREQSLQQARRLMPGLNAAAETVAQTLADLSVV